MDSNSAANIAFKLSSKETREISFPDKNLGTHNLDSFPGVRRCDKCKKSMAYKDPAVIFVSRKAAMLSQEEKGMWISATATEIRDEKMWINDGYNHFYICQYPENIFVKFHQFCEECKENASNCPWCK